MIKIEIDQEFVLEEVDLDELWNKLQDDETRENFLVTFSKECDDQSWFNIFDTVSGWKET